MKIAVITPVSHLPNVKESLKTKGSVYYLENGNFNEVRNLLIKENIDTILCNPNKQDYKIGEKLLKNTNVSLINTCSTGMNHIDTEFCKLNNIEIYSLTKDYELIKNLPSTSELAFTLMLTLLRKIPESLNHTREFKWDYLSYVGRQVLGLKIGIVGHGRLGTFMEKYCKAFGAKVYIYDPYKPTGNIKSLKKLFEKCDVISLHVHVNSETKYMINKEIISSSKKSPYLINTSRGEIVNELDVIEGLINNKLSGYGTDVVEHEFDDLKKSPIINGMRKGLNIIVTPHTGGMTIEGQTKAYNWAVNKL